MMMIKYLSLFFIVSLSSAHISSRRLNRAVLFKGSQCYDCSKAIRRKGRLYMESNNAPTSKDISNLVNEQDFGAAFKALKRNPMLNISKEDGKCLLNNIDKLDPNEGSYEKNQKQTIESSVYLYRRLERQKLLRGFGCIEGEYPEKALDISPAKLEEITGLSVTALTPKERTTYWRLAGILLCAIEYFVGVNSGIDPLLTIIPLTFLLLGIDQLFYKGAVFETVYRALFPEYGSKIIAHEAGHFLVAYLLGVPVRGCVTNAWDARKNPDINGQAGTIFFDAKLAEEMDKQQVTRSSLDRLSVVIMAGIAAEAMKYGKAEGGALDEQSLIGFLNSIQPPWNILRIQGQARWAVMQAILLIKEHINSYNALVKALEEKKSVGDCVFAIEENLPAELPSAKRLEARRLKRKAIERDSILRFIQRMTWSVGGIDETESAATGAILATPSGNDIADFTKKIRQLEDAARKGEAISDAEVLGSTNGVWINDLTSSKTSTATSSESYDFESELVSLSNSPSGNRTETTSASSVEVSKSLDTSVVTSSVVSKPVSSAIDLLKTHRGYQLKMLENLQLKKKKEEAEIEEKLRDLQVALEKVSVGKALARK